MNVISLTDVYLKDFKAYCQKYRYDHDDSYLYEEDMDEFEPYSGKHPTYLLLKDGQIIGVLSLMLDAYFVANHKTRIRIFHCESADKTHYQMLLDALAPLPEHIHHMEMFLQDSLVDVQAIVRTMAFKYYRTSYIMIRANQSAPEVHFPEGYTLKAFVHGSDETTYAHIRNTAFKSLKGSEAPMDLETVQKLAIDPSILTNGMQMLWHHDEAVGILRMIKEEGPTGNYSFVAPIALLPEHHGKGLGTQLLKAGIRIGRDNGYDDCMLSVNAENEQALGLYKKVGFIVDEAVSCFQLALHA